MTAMKWNQDLGIGDQVLRLSTEADAAGLAALMAEPEVEQWWHQNWDVPCWMEYLNGLIADPDSLPLTLSCGDQVTGYVEVYRVGADVLGRHIEHRETDLGMHIALGRAIRGRGLGSEVIGRILAVADGMLDGCERLVAEPDLRNTRSHRAFAHAGFEATGTVQLPDKTAQLMAGRPGPGTASVSAGNKKYLLLTSGTDQGKAPL
jgi:RimJ/RimL family protein N-acetyltransferase